MNKFFWLICICTFVFVTIFIVSVDSNTGQRKVQFSNQSFQINNKGNEIKNNNNTKISLAESNIKNKKINTQNSNISDSNISLKSNNVNLESSKISNSQIDYSNQNTSYNNDYNYENQNINANNSGTLDFKNLDDSNLDNALNNAKNYSYKPTDLNDKPFRQMPNKYAYKNIDWNTWKSNFVNKILDDSLAIRELDNYSYGTLIYYSFTVDRSGAISNVKVKSMTVKPEDKAKLARMIQGYQYQEITAFPAKSQRQKTDVSAVMMLSNESQYSKPNSFNDVEHVKYKL